MNGYRFEEIVHAVSDINGNPIVAERSPDEPWYERREIAEREGHFYAPLVDFALEALGSGDGLSCLVVGSPLFEALELRLAGWEVGYLDIRKPPGGVRWHKGDAREMPFPEASFDAVSSTCVMCHVGLGRYGDRVDPRGDFKMMVEVARVLKPGGRAVLGAGPAAQCRFTRRMGSMHRVYLPADLEAMAAHAGLEVLERRSWAQREVRWRHPGEALTADIQMPDYFSMVLRKPEA